MTTIDQHGDAHDVSGQYALKSQSEPEVHLSPPEAEGTFLFPPASYTGTDQFLTFWGNVQITDGVLSNITAGYAELIRRQANLISVDWGHKYDAVHKNDLHHGSKASQDEAAVTREKAYVSHLAEWYKTHPMKIKAGTARPVARAMQMFYYSSAFKDQSDMVEVQSATVEVLGEVLTTRQVTDVYQGGSLRDYFQDPSVTTAERMEDLRIELQRMIAAR